MAQGVSSLQFLAFIRLRKVIFFPKHEESLCLSVVKQATQTQISFSACQLCICNWRRVWGAAGEALLRCCAFEHVPA